MEPLEAPARHPIVRRLNPENPWDPVTVPVAETLLSKGVELSSSVPDVIEVEAGRPLELHHRYRVAEGSRDREEYRIALRASLGGRALSPVLVRHGDLPGMPDAVRGTLVRRFVPETPGEYEVTFEAYAEYVARAWTGDEVHAWERATERGRFLVRVVSSPEHRSP